MSPELHSQTHRELHSLTTRGLHSLRPRNYNHLTTEKNFKRNRPSRPRRKAGTGAKLRRLRIGVSVCMFVIITLLFTSLSERLVLALGRAAKVQIFPLVMSGALGAIALWLLVTLVFGRIYCSSVCPMGVLQDIFARLPRMRRRWRLRHPYHFRDAKNRLRYPWLALIMICIVAGLTILPSLFDPYSAYGRIAGDLLMPVVKWLGGEKVLLASFMAMGVAVATLIAVAAVAWRRGRLICNTFCPVGSALSLASRWSLFHFDIDTDVCINCRSCERVCKAECISMADHKVDSSRCVMCFDCVDTCNEGAISYTTRHKKLAIPMLQRSTPQFGSATPTPTSAQVSTPSSSPDSAPSSTSSSTPKPTSDAVKIDRRQFLATGLLVAAAPAMNMIAMASDATRRGGLRGPMHQTRPVAPPGRRTMADFLDDCTGCGLCISHCPGNALVHSTNEYGWLHALHPVMDYDRGRCLYDCTLCTDICPTSALNPLTPDDKHIFIIGHARVAPYNCVGCRLCSESCPKFAITMKARSRTQIKEAAAQGLELSPLVAVVDPAMCIGCGVCQNVCPARPDKAIIVDGIV